MKRCVTLLRRQRDVLVHEEGRPAGCQVRAK